MLCPDGRVKILDFGLAKAIEPQAAGSDFSNSPTLLSSAGTQPNFLIGTLAYTATF
jgi:serine/threonine protein kinase